MWPWPSSHLLFLLRVFLHTEYFLLTHQSVLLFCSVRSTACSLTYKVGGKWKCVCILFRHIKEKIANMFCVLSYIQRKKVICEDVFVHSLTYKGRKFVCMLSAIQRKNIKCENVCAYSLTYKGRKFACMLSAIQRKNIKCENVCAYSLTCKGRDEMIWNACVLGHFFCTVKGELGRGQLVCFYTLAYKGRKTHANILIPVKSMHGRMWRI